MANDKTKAKESKAVKFMKGVKAEFRKIIWPDRDTLLKQLAAVLIVSIIVGGMIALIDFGFQNLIDILIGITIGG
jgi:preprotein translocase subunit SecE